MFGLIRKNFVKLEPVPEPRGGFSLQSDGQTLYLYKGTTRIDHGRMFFCMSNPRPTRFDPRTGEYEIRVPTTFRAVFDGQHIDLTVKPEQ